jgi:hypothetical protein
MCVIAAVGVLRIRGAGDDVPTLDSPALAVP